VTEYIYLNRANENSRARRIRCFRRLGARWRRGVSNV